MTIPDPAHDPSRRRVLRGLGGLALLAAVPGSLRAGVLSAEGQRDRELAFDCLHTGESGRLVYWSRGRYLPDALGEIDRLLRDHRSDDLLPIDPALLDLLHAVHQRLESRTPFQLISGYRSPATNEMLRRQGRGVARRSQHLLGKAVDVRLADRDTDQLRRAGLDLGRGGVGSYRAAGFVHLDTGRPRQWADA